MSKELELLIEASLKDGEISEKELAVLNKRAQAEDFDIDKFDLLLGATHLSSRGSHQNLYKL